MSKFVSILLLAAALTAAWLFDTLALQITAALTSGKVAAPAYYGLTIAANLVLAMLWIALARWYFRNTNWPTSIAFFLVGLVLTAFVPLQMSASDSLHPLLLFDLTRRMRAAMLDLGFSARFALSSAYVTVLGAAGFLSLALKTRKTQA